MRFRERNGSLSTHVGSVADIEAPADPEPPESDVVIDPETGMTWTVYPELMAIVTMVGTVGGDPDTPPPDPDDFSVAVAGLIATLTIVEAQSLATYGGTWGDGDDISITTDVEGDGTGSHTYAVAGTYSVELTDPSSAVVFQEDVTVTGGIVSDPQSDLPGMPGNHTKAEIEAWVDNHPHLAADVLAHERARGGSARSTLIDWLEGFIESHDGDDPA